MTKRIAQLNEDKQFHPNILHTTLKVDEIPQLEEIHNNYSGYRVNHGSTFISNFYEIDKVTNSALDQVDQEIERLIDRKKFLIKKRKKSYILHTNN